MYRFSILFLLLVAACNNTPQTSENTPSTQEASQEKAPAQEGIRYEGVLPTEDGDLLSTTIILGENNTYSLLQRSQNKETNREEKGKFGWDEDYFPHQQRWSKELLQGRCPSANLLG